MGFIFNGTLDKCFSKTQDVKNTKKEKWTHLNLQSQLEFDRMDNKHDPRPRGYYINKNGILNDHKLTTVELFLLAVQSFHHRFDTPTPEMVLQ